MAGKGKPGPAPQSADVIALHGNRGHRTKADIEDPKREVVRPRSTGVRMPSDLDHPEARWCWEHHAPELQRLGLLTVSDVATFRSLCEAFALARDALDQLRKRKADGTIDRRTKRFEVVLSDPAHGGRLYRHPGLLAWKTANDIYLQLCREFGMTPSARVGLRPAAAPSPPAGEGRRVESSGADGFAF